MIHSYYYHKIKLQQLTLYSTPHIKENLKKKIVIEKTKLISLASHPKVAYILSMNNNNNKQTIFHRN